jgi:ParB family transcriptional regulator, chromosome partitioning protein
MERNSATKRRLGRGLDALFGATHDEFEGDPAAPIAPDRVPIESDPSRTNLPLALVDPNPFQPRRTFDPLELAALVQSIQQHGLIQPIVTRRVGDRYQLVAGERRLRAAQEAGLAEIPARVIEADDQQVFELAIVENLQRTDLNAIEKARAFRDYIERFGSTQDELAARLSLDRSTVSNFIRLLELPTAIQQTVEAGKLSQGHARALLAFGDQTKQHEICRQIVTEGLSVRQVEALVASERPAKSKAKSVEKSLRTNHVTELEASLRECLRAHVEIRLQAKDRGQIVVEFATNDEFERIVELIQQRCSPAQPTSEGDNADSNTEPPVIDLRLARLP